MAKENRPEKLRNKKSLAFGTISLLITIAVIVIAVIFNVLFEKLVPNNIDLTTNKEFSMSEEAKEFIKTVTKDVEIIGLFDEVNRDIGTIDDYIDYYLRNDINKVIEVLNQFSTTNKKISVDYVDPEKDTLYLVKNLGETRAKDFAKGDFIVKSGEKVTKVSAQDLYYTTTQSVGYGFAEVPYAPKFDGAFVGAIINVTSERDYTIGVVTDHNEYPIDQYYRNMKSDLENRAYQFEEIKLATAEDLSKYDVLLFLGSQTDLTSVESSKLTEYLDDGGNAIFLIDSIQNGPEFNNLNEALSKYNIVYNNDIIKEGSQNAVMDATILYERLEFEQGDFLEDLNNNYLILPISRSIGELKKTADYLKTYPIVYSSNEATSSNYTTGKETKGRQLLGVAVESTASGNTSKILVMGSSGFVLDAFENLDTTNTGLQVISKTLSWMLGSEDFDVPIKRAQTTKLTVTESTAKALGGISVILIPLLITAFGLLVWLRRRHL